MAYRSIREELVNDISHGNLTQRKGIGPCERLRGLAYSPELARRIKHLQAGISSASVSMTVTALDAALAQASPKARELDADDRRRLCLLAVLQRAFPLCDHCKGRGTIYDHGKLVVACEECGGSGKRRFAHKDWRRVFGRALAPEHEAVLDAALSIFAHHDSLGESIVEEAVYGDEA